MLQENQECDEPPRQSASFRVLQEILETGKDPGFYSLLGVFWISFGLGFFGFVPDDTLLKMTQS